MSVIEALPSTEIAIRDVVAQDVEAITTLYGWHVQHGRASFEETPPGAIQMAERIQQITGQGLPWLVATLHDVVVGYCYASRYRSRPAYRYTVEESIYVENSMRGRGIGSSLLAALIARCEQGPWRQMVAIIGDGEKNEGSRRLHTQQGFEVVGHLRSVGFKLGDWRDILIMQRQLNKGDWTLPER